MKSFGTVKKCSKITCSVVEHITRNENIKTKCFMSNNGDEIKGEHARIFNETGMVESLAARITTPPDQ